MDSYGYLCVIFCVFIVTLGNVSGDSARLRTIVLPPVPLSPETPICTSYSGLCHMAYNLTDRGVNQVIHSSHQMCRCPGNQPCETDWHSNSRSITKVFKNAGQEVEVKMSYCNLQHPDSVCRQNEVAVVTRGRGAFTFEIASEFHCRCYRPMYAHRSWRDGDYDYIEYSCGKPRCSTNRWPNAQCMQIQYNGSPSDLIHNYYCRCPWNEECIGGSLPSESNRIVMRTCQQVSSDDIFRRHRNRRRRNN